MEELTTAELAGVSPRELEEWKRTDLDFAQQLLTSFSVGTSRMVDAATHRALKDSDRLMEKLLSMRDPVRFGEAPAPPPGGKRISEMTVAELEMHIGALRKMEKDAANTIDGEAAHVDKPAD